MAFSLEATLVVPLTLGIVVATTGLLTPLILRSRQAAKDVVAAQQEQLNLTNWYQPLDAAQGLRVSPQISLELALLWQQSHAEN